MSGARRLLVVALASAVVTGCQTQSPPPDELGPCEGVTLVIRTSEAFRTREDIERVVAAADAAGVRAISVLAKMDEDTDELASGYAFYASEIAPRAPGWEELDVLAVALETAHARGMRVLAWVPQFHDAALVEREPSVQMHTVIDGASVPYVGRNRELFASPHSELARAYQRSIVREIAGRYDVDGVVIDWVRYDGWATGVDDTTRALYRERYGLDPLSIDFERPSEERTRWLAFRAELVASHVREVGEALAEARPGARYGVYVLPGFPEVSQDVALFADAIDFVAPMAYFDDWELTPEWVWQDVVPTVRARAGDRVSIVPVLDEDWTDEENARVIGALSTETPYVREVQWFAFGPWSDALVSRLGPLAPCAP